MPLAKWPPGRDSAAVEHVRRDPGGRSGGLPAQRVTMHQLEAKWGCAMCVKCGAYRYYNTETARAGTGWKDNCGQGTEKQKQLRKAKEDEKWSTDDMWKIRTGVQLR